jgi:hypothetical protein
MKNIKKFMLLPAMVLPLIFTSCADDRDSNPTLDLSHVNEEFHLNTPANATNSTYDLLSATSLQLTCTQPNYGAGVPYTIRYAVQTSLSNDFTTEGEYTELTTTYTSAKMNVDASELNTAICNLYQKGNTDVKVPETMPVYIRLRAIIDGTDNMGLCYSNSIKLPQVNATYVAPLAVIPDQLYVQGKDMNGGNQKVVPAIYGIKTTTSNSYYTMVYMAEGGTMQWGPEEGDMRGFSRIAKIDDQAGAGVTADADDNLTFGKAGWYTLVFDDEVSADEDGRLTVSSYTLHIYEAHAYIIGASAGDNWDKDNPASELKAPATAGNWESPAFTGAGEMRAYISVPTAEWWRTEFSIYKGKCYWRTFDIPNNWEENVGADYSTKVSVGQKLVVNFDTNTASIE